MSSLAKTEPGRFLSDVIWIGISQLFVMAFGIITMPALTKSYSTETYGVWAQLIATLAFVVPVINLQLNVAVVRFLAGEEDKAKRMQYLGSMLTAILIFSCLAFLVLNFLTNQLSILLFGSTVYINFVRLIFIWTFIEALFYFFSSYYQAINKIKRISIIQTIFLIMRMTVIVVLARTGTKLEILVTYIIIIEATTTLFVIFLIIREDGIPIPNFRRIKEFLSFSLPQISNPIMRWAMNGVDRYLITYFIGLTFTGIYSSSFTLGGTISLFYVPIAYVLLPTVSRAWENNRMVDVKNYFEYSIKLFLTLAIPATAGLAMLSQPILKILATSDYLAGWGIVLIISIGSILFGLYSINVYVVYLIKQTKWLPILFLVTAIVSFSLNFFLIPLVGITGAAISRLIAYFVITITISFWARRIIKYRIDLIYFTKIIVATVIMAAFLYFMKPENVLKIIMFSIAGIAIFGILILLFRTFNKQDRRLINRLIKGSVGRINVK